MPDALRRNSTVILASFLLASNIAAYETGKKYFDMPVKQWLPLPEEKKAEGVRELLLTQRKNLKPTSEQIELVGSCMTSLGKAPTWNSQTLGLLLTKCALDTGILQSETDLRLDSLVGCIKKQIPDFSKDELTSIAFAAVGAGLAKDSAKQEPITTPRTKQVVEALKKCEQK